MTLSEAKKRANKKWDEKNKDRILYLNYRSKARNFIKKMINDDDIEEFKFLLEEREKNGKTL